MDTIHKGLQNRTSGQTGANDESSRSHAILTFTIKHGGKNFSKMSFIDLLKHSLSIIAVFKITVLIRSIIFLAVYLFFVLQNISVVTLIPVALVIFMIFSVFILSRRENIIELNNSLENINNIENLK